MTPRQIKIAAKKEIPDNTFFKEANSKKLLTVIDIARWGFEIGVNYAFNHQWIDVKYEMPHFPKDGDVVVFAKTKDSVYIASYAKDGWFLDGVGKINDEYVKVQYWMPIPELNKK